MAQAKSGDTVKVNYKAKTADGTVIDSSNDDALTFVIGEGQVIPGFERAVIGMSPGESKTEEVSAEMAFGPHLDEQVLTIPSEQFPEDFNPEVGQYLELQSPDGQRFRALVTQTSEQGVTVDANHPLAGQDLVFDIDLVEIV